MTEISCRFRPCAALAVEEVTFDVVLTEEPSLGAVLACLGVRLHVLPESSFVTVRTREIDLRKAQK
jgi:hypothetical protein